MEVKRQIALHPFILIQLKAFENKTLAKIKILLEKPSNLRNSVSMTSIRIIESQVFNWANSNIIQTVTSIKRKWKSVLNVY